MPMRLTSKRACPSRENIQHGDANARAQSTKNRVCKIVGKKRESLPRIIAECFCAAGAYEARDFLELLSGRTIIKISALIGKNWG
jgi:hypothetical protein